MIRPVELVRHFALDFIGQGVFLLMHHMGSHAFKQGSEELEDYVGAGSPIHELMYWLTISSDRTASMASTREAILIDICRVHLHPRTLSRDRSLRRGTRWRERITHSIRTTFYMHLQENCEEVLLKRRLYTG